MNKKKKTTNKMADLTRDAVDMCLRAVRMNISVSIYL